MERRYDAYLLRWWHSAGGERAEVQHVQTGERTALPSLAAACSWLLTQYSEPAADPPGERAPEHTATSSTES